MPLRFDLPPLGPEPEPEEPLAFDQPKREVLTFEFFGDQDMYDTMRACRWCDPERYPATTTLKRHQRRP